MMIGKYDESLPRFSAGSNSIQHRMAINFYKAVCLAVSGRRGDAIQQFKKLQEMDPTFPGRTVFLSRVYVWTGNHAGAVEERAKAVELDGSPENARLLRDSFASEAGAPSCTIDAPGRWRIQRPGRIK